MSAELTTVTARAQAVFQEVFDDASLRLHPAMVADDVEGWDSFNHITLVMSLEEAFGLRFPTREVMGWKNVGEMLESVARRAGG